MKKLGLVFLFLFVGTKVCAVEVQFKKKQITVGTQKIMAEIAETTDQHTRGLMYRKELGADQGMLFIFKTEEPRTFWMKNTFIPLSIGFFSADKKLVDIQEMEAVKTEMEVNPPTYASAQAAQYALEAPPGWFKKHKLKLGDILSYK